jgi:hypothetical protein
MTTEQLKFDEKAVLEVLNTKHIWWKAVYLAEELALLGVPTDRLQMILGAFVADGYVLTEHGYEYALNKDGRALLQGWDTPKRQPALEELLKDVPQHAVHFSLSYSPDRHNWRGEIDDMSHTEFAYRNEPIEAFKAVFEQYAAYEKAKQS